MGLKGKKPSFSPEEMHIISQNLRTLRIKNGFTLIRLSEKIDIPFSTLAMYESGWANISRPRLKKMGQFYGINPEDLTKEWDEKL